VLLVDDHAVTHVHDAVCGASEVSVVGDDDQRRTIAIQSIE
jgi:hypothetical protein